MARSEPTERVRFDLVAGSPHVRAQRDGHFQVSTLTPRQREIAGLIARGLPNADIARQLVLTPGTVANHVGSILQRLQLDSRTQVAAWAVEHGLHGGQDRLLTMLERLLELHPESVKAAMGDIANLVANALGADKVFFTGEAYADKDGHHPNDDLTGLGRELNVRSQVAVPLEIGNVKQGVLMAQSTQPDFFTERDFLFLRAVSHWVVYAIQHAELAERSAAAAVEQGRRVAAEELVTVLAHDLRNHMAPIRGRLELLYRRAIGEQHGQNLHDTAELRNAVDRFGRLISDLLDIARIDQGLFEVTAQPMDLAALVRDAAAVLEVPGTPIEVEAPPELNVVADPVRIRQAVENLMANAVQHAPTDTSVRVELARESSQPRAVVTITDQGPGIDPALLPRLFERFARSPGSTGLGIGLFLARQIAEAHGGRIEVTSRVTGGTQFRLVLPAEPG
jgi:signal transduction histidine kinase/DNA-binding CsgD family transcriptional regulator